ncbi:hypothetical protein MJ904_17850 [Massilia sp. MB5]|uniref:hypothetical protein n=1 Tax=Massilia sp. MB5 TaxID=2919578 RepID=UPI001F0DF6E0|nr:hypothetical protein [Massilia sp. MB5]UMR28954.1 hypothetical protein MJ904_17850 [Massilia sp. MB5]
MRIDTMQGLALTLCLLSLDLQAQPAASPLSEPAAVVPAPAEAAADKPILPVVAAFAAAAPNGSGVRSARDESGILPAPLGEEQLSQLRGGSDTPWSEMKLSGAVSNNKAVQVLTGSNTITEGSFANASGLPMVIQNSGANVLIQNATIVNVQLK